ncbi:MAG: selenocysteine-specific translation elongation factor, partial [Chloroflexi bacterium]|nr:selenocysteine-specific translation elongation factor [Chloroflexota bacterium]
MFVVGTAGHVDHGKSSLVRALTGINPDRLREEQQREMTIDLGFAWVTLPSGREISVVDVPGHEDFIRNMLAGVGGIDLAVLVVAADESVMPQTREHLAILDLLKVPLGVVALTKADLIEDPDWLDLVVEELRETLAHSALADAPIVPVSSVTGQGLPELLSSIDTLLDSAQGRADLDMPRLPIDRVFSIAGFGTVVTGTLSGGRFRVGDAVEIVPGGLTARIRGLQAHKAKVEEAIPGMRVAVNLTGLDVSDISRGQVVAKPGVFRATSLVDARLRSVLESPIAIQHGMEVEFFSGSASVLGRVRLLDCDELSAGHSGWAQIVLREPVALARGDRFVIRLPSPSMTLGGGGLVEVHPVRRHRRLDQDVLSRLEALDTGDPAARLLALLEERGALAVGALFRECGMEPDDVRKALGDLLDRGAALVLGDAPVVSTDPAATDLVLSRLHWDRTMERAESLLRAFHKAQPLRPGMPREE